MIFTTLAFAAFTAAVNAIELDSAFYFPPMHFEPLNPAVCTELDITGFSVIAQYTVANGGGSGNEYPQNLVKSGTEEWNKWYEASSSRSWVVLHSHVGSVRVNQISFRSANDSPARDPGSVTITADGVNLGTFGLSWTERWQWTKVPLGYGFAASDWRFDFVNGSGINELQLGQIAFFNGC